jgi:hypothetical protein
MKGRLAAQPLVQFRDRRTARGFGTVQAVEPRSRLQIEWLRGTTRSNGWTVTVRALLHERTSLSGDGGQVPRTGPHGQRVTASRFRCSWCNPRHDPTDRV